MLRRGLDENAVANTLLAFLVLLPSIALANDRAEAIAHYKKATAHFAVGEFIEAAEEYQAAFKLKQDPALLYNAAQAYRSGNNLDKALLLYRNYLRLYPDDKNVPEVREQIAKLKEAIAAAEAARTNPPVEPKTPAATPESPTPQPPPAPTPVESRVAPTTTTAATTTTTTANADQHRTPV